MKLFVYGTFKRGKSRAGALAEQRFLGEARTLPKYRMYDCGSYPGLVEAGENGVCVEGELWEVDDDTFAKLDDIEGVDENLYRRERVELQAPYQKEEVVTYFYQRGVSALRDCGSSW